MLNLYTFYDCFLSIKYINLISDLQNRIQDLIESLPLEVLLLRRQRKLQLHGAENEDKETLQELSPREVFERRLALEIWQGEEQEEKKKRLLQCFDQVLSDLLLGNEEEIEK